MVSPWLRHKGVPTGGKTMKRIATVSALALTACTPEGTLLDGMNLFTLEDDRQLGAELQMEIQSNPSEYPVLDEAQYPEAYEHIYRIRDSVLDSGQVRHRDDFEWETYIIDDDETLNAFCAPGGYMYVYSGLIKHLEQEDELVGVMGHEIAHADLRHSTEQLSMAYGMEAIMEIVLGEEPGLAADILSALVGMSFSRSDESQADEHSVIYLCDTEYAADGAAGFFEKLEGFELPEFLSTHPSSENRVEEIHALALEYGCSVEQKADQNYQALIDNLP
jgi:beta-barrel assembly-enhancing protease